MAQDPVIVETVTNISDNDLKANIQAKVWQGYELKTIISRLVISDLVLTLVYVLSREQARL